MATLRRASLSGVLVAAGSAGLVAFLVVCGGEEAGPALSPTTSPTATTAWPPLRGERTQTCPSGIAPRGLAFDGEYIWKARFGGTTVAKRALVLALCVLACPLFLTNVWHG
jgi:hypothetical protein